MSLTAAGIVAGLGAVGSLFGRTARERRRRQESDRSYNLAREQFAYTQRANEMMRQREDTQIQRMRADAEAAGIHPTALIGGGAGGGAGGGMSPSGGAPAGGGYEGGSVLEQAKIGASINDVMAHSDLLRAQADHYRQQTDDLQDPLQEELLRETIHRIRMESWESSGRQALSEWQARYIQGQLQLALPEQLRALRANSALTEAQAQDVMVDVWRNIFEYTMERRIGHRQLMGSQSWAQLRSVVMPILQLSASGGAPLTSIQDFTDKLNEQITRALRGSGIFEPETWGDR